MLLSALCQHSMWVVWFETERKAVQRENRARHQRRATLSSLLSSFFRKSVTG